MTPRMETTIEAGVEAGIRAGMRAGMKVSTRSPNIVEPIPILEAVFLRGWPV